MDKIQVVKYAARFIVGASTGWTTREIVKNNVNPENRLQEAEALVAGLVAGSAAASASEVWIDRKIDRFVAKYNEIKTQKTTQS